MISTSRLAMCESSWASTPSISFGSRRCQRPVVTQTAACFGERPVAKAFGTGVSMIATFGFGRSAIAQSRSTMSCSSGASSRRDDLRARGAERELVRGEVLEERDADDDHEHRHQADVQNWIRATREDDVEEAEQARSSRASGGSGRSRGRRACVSWRDGTFEADGGVVDVLTSASTSNHWDRMPPRAPTRSRLRFLLPLARLLAPVARPRSRAGSVDHGHPRQGGREDSTEQTVTVAAVYRNGDPTAGKDVFTSAAAAAVATRSRTPARTARSARCSTRAKPALSLAVLRLTHGQGAMPNFTGS